MTTPKLTLRLLGAPRIEIDQQPLSGLPSRAAEALLIYLAVTNRPHARDVLAELLWNDRDQQQGLANLRAILSGMRRKLKPYLDITRHTVALQPDAPIWLDVAAFERDMHSLHPMLQDKEPLSASDAACLEETLALYQGDFLEGFYLRSGLGFEEWALLQRERLRRLAQKGLLRLAQHHLHSRQYTSGVIHAQRLLAIDPLDERALRAAMLLLARSGQHAAAIRHYKQLVQRLDEELALSPTAATTTLYERIRSAHSRPRHNLPAEPTPFVGRQAELDLLQNYLDDPQRRLITITGPGGVGKTRLMRHFARLIAEKQPGRFLHGVCYVPLAHLEDPALLPGAIAAALHLTLSSSDAAAELADFLREKELLLLLDNVEHLLHDAETSAADNGAAPPPLLARILHEAPLVTLIATSRLPLRLREEWLFDLGGLPAPPRTQPRGDGGPPDGDYPAVDLFLQSARRASRHFHPTVHDLQAIAAICRRLDGLPLAIELAAAWIPRFTPAQIDARIRQGIDFLKGDAHNLPARHRNLRAVVEYAWQLLSPPEKRTAAALAVFHGPFNTDGAVAITAYANAGSSVAMPQRLADLTAHAILRQNNADHYEMHPLLQQIAAEHLAAESQRRNAARNAHAAHIAHYLHRRTNAVKGGNQRQALDEIGAIIDDIRAAWDWDLQRVYFHNIIRSLDALFHFYWARGWLQEGANIARRVAAAAEAEWHGDNAGPHDRLLLIRARMWHGDFTTWLGNYDHALQLLQEAQTLAHEDPAADALLPEKTFIASALGRLHYFTGHNTAAIPIFEEGLALARRLQDDYWIALLLNGLAIAIVEAHGDYARARILFDESLERSRRIEDHFGVARALLNMATTYPEPQQREHARRLFHQSLTLYRQIEYAHGIAAALNYLGRLAYEQGDYEEARALIAESYDLNRDSGDRRAILDALTQLGNVAREAGQLHRARQHYEEALRLARHIGADQAIITLIIDVAALALRAADPSFAHRLLTFVLHHPTAGAERHDQARTLLQQNNLPTTPQPDDPLTLQTAITQILTWPLP